MAADHAVVMQGSGVLCREYSLMLEARGIEHELLARDALWELSVVPELKPTAEEEIRRYTTERAVVRPAVVRFETYPGWLAGCGNLRVHFIAGPPMPQVCSCSTPIGSRSVP